MIIFNKVPTKQVEVWKHAKRAAGTTSLAYQRSIWAQEVTIHLSIPHSAVIGK